MEGHSQEGMTTRRLVQSRCAAHALLLFAVAAISKVAAQQLPIATGATTVVITPERGYFTEPAIALDPRNPLRVLAAYQDNAHIAYSSDGGRNWAVQSVEPPQYRVSGDVSLAYDGKGNAYVCYMAFNRLGRFNYWAKNSSRNGLYVRRSLDGGATWEQNDIPIVQQPESPTVPWEDKPYIVADNNSSSPRFGNLYVGWTRWTLADSQILFSRSTDAGKSWSEPVEIDKHRGLPRDDNGALEGFAGTVGRDGTLFVVWADNGNIVLTTSRDGGRTFSEPRNVIQTAPIMFQLQDLSRGNGFPQIGIGPSGKSSTARLYVSWSDYRNGDVDVFCTTSVDGGTTWSEAVRVNDDELHDGADQFFQWLAVDPVDGSANVLFYDRRSDPQNRSQTVTLARSVDGGRTFRNYAWSRDAFTSGDTFLGDYTGIGARGGHVYGIWTEKPPVAPEPASTVQPNRRSPEYLRSHGTVIVVGTANFKTPP